MHKPYDVFVDLDGVLADFFAAVLHRTGGKDFNHADYSGTKEKAAGRAAILMKEPNIFANLRPMPDFDQLWHFLKQFNPDILTAYARWDEAGSKAGKHIWNNKYLHVDPNKFHIVARQNKKIYAMHNGHPCLLIDDFPTNIQEWTNAGGVGILHKNAHQTIAQMKALGYGTSAQRVA